MIFEPVDQIIRRIMGRYNRHPEGWSVLVDSKGDMLVVGPSSGYRLKLVHLSPGEYTGVGVRFGKSQGLRMMVKNLPQYGFRPLSREETRDLFLAINRGDKPADKRIKSLLEMNPVPTWDIDEGWPGAVVTGPLIAHPNLSMISRRQKELETRLAMEADKLFRRKFPLRAKTYS